MPAASAATGPTRGCVTGEIVTYVQRWTRSLSSPWSRSSIVQGQEGLMAALGMPVSSSAFSKASEYTSSKLSLQIAQKTWGILYIKEHLISRGPDGNAPASAVPLPLNFLLDQVHFQHFQDPLHQAAPRGRALPSRVPMRRSPNRT